MAGLAPGCDGRSQSAPNWFDRHGIIGFDFGYLLGFAALLSVIGIVMSWKQFMK